MRLVVCGTLALACLGPPRLLAGVDEPTATEILDRMANAYRSATTYRDSGSVRTVFDPDRGRRFVRELRFNTAFLRPDAFRFEHSDSNTTRARGIVWARGRDVRYWWGLRPAVTRALSIGHGIGVCAGVSRGASTTVPGLLLAGVAQSGVHQTNFSEPTRLPDGMLGSVSCFRLGVRHRDEPATLWLDRSSYLIRRIDSRRVFEDFRTETTTLYEPVLDAVVDETLLAFDPPGKTSNPKGESVVLSFDGQGVDFAAWNEAFQKELFRNWIRPRELARDLTGQIDFEFTVERDGSISAWRMLTPSGVAALDRAAEVALTSSQLRPLPEDYVPDRMPITMRFFCDEASK